MTVNSVCFPAQARGQASSIHPLLTVPLLSPCGSINGVRLHLPGQHKCLFTKLLIRVWLAAVRPHLRPLAAGLCSAWMRGVVPALLRSLHVLAIRAHFKDEPNARDHSCPSVFSLAHRSLPALLPALFTLFPCSTSSGSCCIP